MSNLNYHKVNRWGTKTTVVPRAHALLRAEGAKARRLGLDRESFRGAPDKAVHWRAGWDGADAATRDMLL